MARLQTCFALLTGAAAAIVLDDPGATLAGHAVKCPAGGYNGSFVHNNNDATSKQDFASFEIEVNESGCYLVEEYHPASVSGCTSHALGAVTLQAEFCRGQRAYGFINQSAAGDQWNEMGLLPFMAGWPAKIMITRDGFDDHCFEEWCPQGQCLWVADAFRLTRIASTCSHAAHLLAQRDNPSNQTTTHTTTTTTSTTTTTTEAVEPFMDTAAAAAIEFATSRMALQITLNNPSLSTEEDATAVFKFQPPVDGCYVLEERHPHIQDLGKQKLAVNYCRGLTAEGKLDYSDGLHDQWNYVATLPFFDEQEGSVVVPANVLDTSKPHHEFRLTHVGASCVNAASHTYTAQIRIHTDFDSVASRVPEFKEQVSRLLAKEIKVPYMRMPVSHVWAGSIVARLTVLPAAHGHVLAGSPATAYQVAQSLGTALASEDVGLKLCTAASADVGGCHAKFEGFEKTKPLVYRVDSAPMTGVGYLLFMLQFVALAALAVAMTAAVAWCLCNKGSKEAKAGPETVVAAVPVNNSVEVEVPDLEGSDELTPEKKAQDQDIEIASTATPDTQCDSEISESKLV